MITGLISPDLWQGPVLWRVSSAEPPSTPCCHGRVAGYVALWRLERFPYHMPLTCNDSPLAAKQCTAESKARDCTCIFVRNRMMPAACGAPLR